MRQVAVLTLCAMAFGVGILGSKVVAPQALAMADELRAQKLIEARALVTILQINYRNLSDLNEERKDALIELRDKEIEIRVKMARAEEAAEDPETRRRIEGQNINNIATMHEIRDELVKQYQEDRAYLEGNIRNFSCKLLLVWAEAGLELPDDIEQRKQCRS